MTQFSTASAFPSSLRAILSSERLALAFAAAFGLWLAVYLYGGMIDPTRVAWLMRENDSLQHFMGWHFFRRDDWQWPLGALSNLGSDINTSIVYSDAIPLFALPLKLFHAWLPDPFQYLGLAVTVNLMLNATLACGLLLRCGLGPWSALAGSLLFLSLPMATMRGLGGHGHEALTAHWLILLGMALVIFRPQPSWNNALRWLGVLTLGLLVHFYLFFMVGVLWGGWWLRGGWLIGRQASRSEKLRWCMIAVGTPLLVVALMWIVGYFQHGVGGTEGGGYGVFSAELLTYVNPLSHAWFHQGGLTSLSYVLPGWLTPVWGQYEGQAYAGLGALGVLACALAVFANRGVVPVLQRTPGGVWVFLLTLAMFIFALSDKLVVGYRVYELGYGKWLGPLTDYLRSSGRLAWPLLYVLLLGALALLVREWSRRRMMLVLAAMVLVQWQDLKPWHVFVHDVVRSRLELAAQDPLPYAVLRDSSLRPLWENHDKLVALPAHDLTMLRPYQWIAAEHDMSLNVAHLARVTEKTVDQATRDERAALRQGVLAADTVYLLTTLEWTERVCGLPATECRAFDPITIAWQTQATDARE